MAKKKADAELRYKRVAVCKECGECHDHKQCASVRKPLRPYNGLRFTADGFDCALPVALDSHSVCSYKCLYCFSNFLGGHGNWDVGQMSLHRLDHMLSGDSAELGNRLLHKALKRHTKRPTPLQFGALTDPFDNIERNQGWALQLPALLQRHNQPIRVSTKGRLLAVPEYLDAWALPETVWVAFSIITPDDELLARIDRYAPSATERLAAMAALSKRGVSTSLRFRPAIPHVSDATPKHPKAYKELIERAAAAGAKALSLEVLFVPGKLEKNQRLHWTELEKIVGVPLRALYREITPRWGACIRPDRSWTEDFVHACRDVAHANGMAFGISDPVWKELNDFGCCCGIDPADPVFGNWERENATNIVVQARKAFEAGHRKKLWGVRHLVPPWADDWPMKKMCMMTGVSGVIGNEISWGDKLRLTWNDVRSNRGPLKYFQGILRPAQLDKDGNVLYRYNHMPRQHVPSIWKV